MVNLNVAVIGAVGYSRFLGKPSTASDITFFDLKQGDTTVSFVEPTRYPEKLAPLFYSVSLADIAILVVDQIGPAFGESVLMLDCAGTDRGFMILRNYITEEQVSPFTKGTKVEGYRVVPEDPVSLKEELMRIAESTQAVSDGAESAPCGSVPVDHHFDVKGVGSVVLGTVVGGVVRRHDKLRLLPGSRTAVVRSIQKHDDDSDVAFVGDRVGLALKGMTNEELDRGMVLTSDERMLRSADLVGEARLVKYWLNPIAPGMVLHVGHWMQFEPARVVAVSQPENWREVTLTLSFQKEMVFLPGAKAILTYLEGGKLRVVGTIEMPRS